MTYEHILKSFLDLVHAKFGVQHLDDIDTPHAKAFLEEGIQWGITAKTTWNGRVIPRPSLSRAALT